jgi:hypothetical protein
LPVLTLLFLCSFLDRTNPGNAKTYNLEANLNMTDNQYDIGLAIFYATYIARQVILQSFPYQPVKSTPLLAALVTPRANHVVSIAKFQVISFLENSRQKYGFLV